MLSSEEYQNNGKTNLTKIVIRLYWEDEKGEAK